MKAVKVQYTVSPEFVDQNKANIRTVMHALRANPVDGLYYSAFLLDDGQTFVHISQARDEETIAELTTMDEFKAFQTALRESKPVAPPAADNLNLVAAGFDL